KKKKKKEDQRKRKEEEDEQRKKKEQEEDQRKKKDEEDEQRKKKEEDEAESMRKGGGRRRKEDEAASDIPIIIVPTSFSWDEDKTTTRVIYEISCSTALWKDTRISSHLMTSGSYCSRGRANRSDDKSKEQHFDYAFRKLDRAPNEFDLLFSPMHVGTNHWALLVIHIKEKEFHVYDSLRNKFRRDIPQYVEELKRYLKGKHVDTEKWPLRYPDPCLQ
ncbi:hypothetical protein Taro_052833, partial [Colocasia esculenta]|nr:hypothetical protein [Colocasia esculenta]